MSSTTGVLRGRDSGECPACGEWTTGTNTTGGFVPDLYHRCVDVIVNGEQTTRLVPACQQTTGSGHVYQTLCVHCGAPPEGE